MEKDDIVTALQMLSSLLAEAGVNGEICLYGGAVMCLVYHARASTKDVDAVFEPSDAIRRAAARVADRLQLPDDWLNDGVKGFLVEHPRKIWGKFSNLTIYMAEPEYLFAMKALAARIDTMDRDDMKLLLDDLNIQSVEDAASLVEKYYPKRLIKPATMYFLEELFDEKPNA